MAEKTPEQRLLAFTRMIARMNYDGELLSDEEGDEAEVSFDHYHETMISLIHTARDLVTLYEEQR